MKDEFVMVPRELAEEINAALVFHGYVTLPRGLQIALTKPAEQHQGEPAGYFTFCHDKNKWLQGKPKGPEFLHLFTLLYTHADPGQACKWRNEAHRFNLEVEQLRFELREAKALANGQTVLRKEDAEDWAEERDALRAQLAERDALLAEITKRHWSGVDFDLPADLVNRIKALSASAEPSAPDCATCNDEGAVGNVLDTVPCPDCAAAPPVERDEREAFEKHYASMNDGFVPGFYEGEYDWDDAQPCWLTWQARAALERKP